MEDSAPGFRFFPTEEELVSFYLINKLEHTRSDQLHRVIPEVNIYELEPWQLPHHAGEVCRGDTEQWFFFAPRQMREAKGGRPNRTTSCGYWKATGSPGYVYSSDNRVIGEKKTMVFYMGKAPTGRKTKWKMTEYKAIAEDLEEAVVGSCTASVPKLRHEYSVCRVYVISGNFTAFDRRPPGVLTGEMMDGQVVENVPNMIPQNTHLVGETSQWEPASAAIEDGREGSEEPDMETLGQYPQYFSREQMDWL